MTPTAQITTTKEEIIIRIPRIAIEKSGEGKINIRHLRGLMKRSRFAKIGSVAAQHAAWRKEHAIS